MALSDAARNRLGIALTDLGVLGPEVAAAIDAVTAAIPSLITPATGTAIPVDKSYYVKIVTAGAETNTLAIPTFIGQKMILVCDTYAVGDRVITVAAAINQTGNTIMTFGAVRDNIVLEAITIAGVLRWQITGNDGVALSGP